MNDRHQLRVDEHSGGAAPRRLIRQPRSSSDPRLLFALLSFGASFALVPYLRYRSTVVPCSLDLFYPGIQVTRIVKLR